MAVSEKKRRANKANALKGGRPTGAESAAADRIVQEILHRHDERLARLAAKRLLRQTGEVAKLLREIEMMTAKART